MLTARAFALVVTAASLGCEDTPARGFERFFSELAHGDPAAFDRLSAGARAAFAEQARAHGQEPAAFLVSAPPKTTVKQVTVVHEDPSAALLVVQDALGGSERVHMVKEGGHWKVDVSP